MRANKPTDELQFESLLERWSIYLGSRNLGDFAEFTMHLSNLGVYFGDMRLPGLTRLCEGLENAAVAKLDATHPLPEQDVLALQRQIDTLVGALRSVGRTEIAGRGVAHRSTDRSGEHEHWVAPRGVCIFSAPSSEELAENISRQLSFIGFDVAHNSWMAAEEPEGRTNLAVIFLPPESGLGNVEFDFIRAMRERYRVSQLFYVGGARDMSAMIALMRNGIDVTFPEGEPVSSLIMQVIDLVEDSEKPKYRVLVVEDSKVASVAIQRTLREHGVDTLAVTNPSVLLDEIKGFNPDLVLMDMQMPEFDGVEATRVLRQIREYKSLPIVYLSGEMDVGKQMDALRLGGDQFLTKPFNPIVLSAVVKTKIERYRSMLRSSQTDGLTGLLNHTASKSELDKLFTEFAATGDLAVVMVDIDNFKSINDVYGHPVGDLVIRGLAWLLKGKLRSNDLIGRYGGEEFIVALPGANPQRAIEVIEDIRISFATLPHLADDTTIYATFSAGIASLPGFNEATDMTRAADQALLQAKRSGRNRVISVTG
jgi:diguanylate cyclase (GGDEF)-like protein